MSTDQDAIDRYTALYRLKKKLDSGHLMVQSDTRAIMSIMPSERYTPTITDLSVMTSAIMEIRDTIEAQHECPKEVATDVISYRLEDVAKKNPHIDWNRVEEDLDRDAEFKEMLNKLTSPREIREMSVSAHKAQLVHRRLTHLKSLEEFKNKCRGNNP